MRGLARSTPVIAALVLVVFWPLAAMVREATRPADDSGPGAGELVPTSRPGEVARPIGLAFETIRLIGATEAIALPLGLALAFVLFRTDAWGRRGMLGALGLSAFVPVPLIATAWLGGFGNAGRLQMLGGAPLLVGWSGAAFLHAMACLPWVVVILGVGLRGVEPELEESARLDLPPWGVVLRVTFRRSLGALAAAALAVAVLTGGDMTVTDLLMVRTYAEEAYTRYQSGDSPGASAVALPPMILLGLVVLLGARALLRLDPARVLSASGRSRDWRLGRWRVPVGLGVVASAGNLLALPLYSLIWHAGRVGGAPGVGPRWSLGGLMGTLANAARELYSPGFARPIRSPLLSSLILAGVAALASVAVAWSLAWLARKPGPWRGVVALTVAVTLAVPGPVAGMALVVAYFDWPRVYGSPLLLILAYVLRTLPYALVVLWPAVRSLPAEYLEVAWLEGHGAWGQARRVAIPLTLGAVAAAWGVSFALAMGELPAANLVAPPGTMPLAVLVWTLLHRGVESHLAGVGLITLGVIGLAGSVAAWGLGWAFSGGGRGAP